jgi:tetratricopeptide (TPR) repeat protein
LKGRGGSLKIDPDAGSPVKTALLLLCALLAAAPAAAAPVEAPAGALPAPEGRVASAQAIGHYLGARRAEGEGDFGGALEELRLALVFDAQSAQLRVVHAEVLARLARFDEAETEARRAVAVDPEGEAGADAWLLLGRVFWHRHDSRHAADALRTAAALELRHARLRGPDEDQTPDPEPWRLLGRVLSEAGDEAGAAKAWDDLAAWLPAEAARGFREMAKGYLEARDAARGERYLRRAVEVFPGDLEGWKRLGQLEERRRRFAEARTAWEAALRAEPEDLEALAALGRLSLRLSDAASARAYFRQLRLLDPDDAGAAAAAAMGLVEARRSAEALDFLEGWDGPPDARLHFVRGLALEELKRWAEAAQAFSLVPPDDRELWASSRMSRSQVLARAGQHAEALAGIEQAIAARPQDARLVTTRAWILERMGRGAEAVRSLEKAIAAREKAGDADGAAELYDALGASLAKDGRSAEAVAVLRRALSARPRSETLLYALGQAQERAGEADAAVAQMRALLVLNPDHAEALNFVGYSLAEKGVRLEEAERLVQRALELRPDSGYFLDSMGWVYFQKGDLLRAVTTLEQADALSGPEPTILEHLGDAYRRAQRGADAEKAYARALRSIEAGESQDGPEKTAAQRTAVERKLRELQSREARPSHN